MNKLAEINQITCRQPEGRIIFENALQIKLSPHIMPFRAWGIWAGPDGVYVLDGGGEWHGPLLESQVNSELMINSIYQRLQAIQLKPVSVVVANYDQVINATIFE